MYFPSDINFQYFFFDTYPGYFLQMLPIALLAGVIYAVYRRKRANLGRTVLASLFVCYLTGLLCLTLFEQIIGGAYYVLFYHMPSGRDYRWFVFIYDFVPDFFRHFGSENMGNLLMYLPFGILYPLFREGSTWKRIVLAGVLTSAVIELLQPIFGRSFDINDIILNVIGVIVSASVFCIGRAVLRRAVRKD